ncbi:replicative DNA helicase [Arenibaculum pallidiluteum]|uniref:replicative DNA helicase n=1 Tax=Arenibaculum pallidiluteum TaxID=2812559 RepID=UPI001A975744|nr:replicative DNA helicase [Arenibaculum pallidiluteum]
MSTNAVALRPVDHAEGQPGYRVMPHNTEAEQGLLGAILTNNKAYERVAEFLKAEHFYDPLHQRVFAAVESLISQGRVADPVTLKGFFEKDPDLGGVGGAAYLAELAAQVVSVINAEHYGRVIHDLFLRRRLIDIGEETVNEAYDQKVDADGVSQIEQAEQKLFELASLGDVKGGFVSFSDSLKLAIDSAAAAYKRDSAITGVTTGLIDMDRKLGGLHRSDLLILAGRPSMGKTSLAVNMAFNAAKAWLDTGGKEGAGVAFYSLEMSAEQLANRILADEARVPSEKIRRGDLKNEDFQRFAEAAQRVGRCPFYIDDTPALSINAVRTRSRRLARSAPSGLGLIVVDYLQLLRGSSSSSENRVQEISEITRGLKAIAKELNVPVLALSQLSRAVEQREDKRPLLSDLRESGSIEQDADVVMFVFREPYYLERSEPARRPDESDDKFNDRYQRWQQRCEEVHATAEVIIAKQRHGPIGTVRLHFEGEYTRFGNLDTQHGGGNPFEE